MKVVRPRVSFSDLQRMPEDGHRYELYDGEMFVVPAPIPRHQRSAFAIAKLFDEFAREHGGEVLVSPIDIVFSEYNVVQPDVVFFQRSRHHLIPHDEAIRSSPDIAVEVLSPSTESTDRGKKMQLLVRYGVAEYWIADPVAQTVEVYSLQGSSYHLSQRAGAGDQARSTLLNDLAFPVLLMFPNPSTALPSPPDLLPL